MIRLHTIIAALPDAWIRNFVQAFEAGSVQNHPQARFVNARGERCVAAALTAASSSADFMLTHGATFLGSPLEELSRRFESGRITAQVLYEECLLLLATRSAPARRTPCTQRTQGAQRNAIAAPGP